MRDLGFKCAMSAVSICLIMGGSLTAAADTSAQIDKRTKQALENFDLMEYEAARDLLNQTITAAKRYRLENSPATARAYLALGVVYFSGFNDVESAKLQFIDAVRIDSTVEIGVEYKTSAMQKLLDAAKTKYGAGGAESAVDCGSVRSISHTQVGTTATGNSTDVVALVSGNLRADRVSVFYRSKGKTAFAEAKMRKQGECQYRGVIPGGAAQGDYLQYYIAAANAKGKTVAKNGSGGAPHLIEITATAGDDGGAIGGDGTALDDEDPLNRKRKTRRQLSATSSTAASGVTKPSRPGTNRWFLSGSTGTAGGFVTGVTEQVGNKVGCCFAPELVHVNLEVGRYFSRRTALSLGFRGGFPIGANRPGHSVAAPAGLIRLRYGIDRAGDGVQLIAMVGGGIMRHTVKLDGMIPDGDTDTVASGPLMVGAGIGYTKAMGSSLGLFAELNGIAGLPVVESVGETKPEFGVNVDLNFGVMLSF